jgi:hypothetical protein
MNLHKKYYPPNGLSIDKSHNKVLFIACVTIVEKACTIAFLTGNGDLSLPVLLYLPKIKLHFQQVTRKNSRAGVYNTYRPVEL